MALGDVMSGEHRPTTRRDDSEVCGVADGGGTAVACNSRNTKLAELRFRVWLTGDGARQIELARA
jgi:hypothetical protein